MIYYENGSPSVGLSHDDLRRGLYEALEKLGERRKILAVPPDYTRLPSRAGELTEITWEYYGEKLTDILPALGTHTPMTEEQIDHMFGKTPKALFRDHDWRNDVLTLGEVPAEYIRDISEGKVDFSWPAQVNRLLVEGGFDLILSIGQVVPHEVVGMANYNKNILVGTGGSEGINKSHYIGAVYGMERMMGKADTPVRRVFNYATEKYLKDLPIVYVLTVVGVNSEGAQQTYGLFVGDDLEVFDRAARLSLQVNFVMVEKPLKKVIVWLDPTEFKSTWLGNKSIYRTRMAIDDGGELIVLAPALKEFGEDKTIDLLIRKYGYFGTPHTLKAVSENQELRDNLGAAAHLIHGSSEGRFSVTYCPGKEDRNLTREEIESVGFQWGDINEMMRKYDPSRLKEGFNRLPDGEEIYYISSPALGLWAHKDRFA
ncbi:MAG: lactate racemase domain-containing protein [Proteiniphilum sp.]|jgi:nickel-dependent lactate racemase|uniref:lactate racemase domain-containing protein n=1 Tax=Proteiniphilum sp. TaxID=1926877 RepID=UPI002B211532|nr:lactate racemase domain-containing protein [Proteiniphilum sp.]MEA5129687.1 lactate racemase domain-containing protein [Proteiniphilum sp.]